MSTRLGLSSGVVYLAIYFGGVRTMRMWYVHTESNSSSSGGDLRVCIPSMTLLCGVVWCGVV